MTKSESKDLEKENRINRTKNAINPIGGAALTLNSFYDNRLDLETLIRDLMEKTNEVDSDNLACIEQMLVTQAVTLNIIFNRCVVNAGATDTWIDQIERFANIALRAQNHFRKTALALAAIKHPPQKQIVEQQNIAVNQQVNNGAKSPVRDPQKVKNELLSDKKYALCKKAESSIKPVEDNTQMEAVEIRRCKDA